jgi:hypothetical protein
MSSLLLQGVGITMISGMLTATWRSASRKAVTLAPGSR